MRTLLAVAALSVLTGCAARQASVGHWRLAASPNGLILHPPRESAATLDFPKARATRARNNACDIHDPQMNLTFNGRAAHVAVDPAAIAAAPQIALTGPQSATGEQVRDNSWWPRFQSTLLDREHQGCIAPGQSRRIAGGVVENLALPPLLGYKLRYGDYLMDGHLDLGPLFAIKSVTPLPISAGGVPRFETTYYDVQQRSDGTLRLALRGPRPTGPPLQIATQARYVRLFFRAWRISGDYRVALLATRESGVLDAMTADFEKDPERFCRDSDPRRVTCISVPMDMTLTAEMKLLANGKPAYIPVGGNVAELLRGRGIRDPQSAVSSIDILRPYSGVLTPIDFDRTRPDILSLTLIAGDQVRWGKL